MIGGEDRDPVAAGNAELRFERARGRDDALAERPVCEIAAREPQRNLLRREVGVAGDEVGEIHGMSVLSLRGTKCRSNPEATHACPGLLRRRCAAPRNDYTADPARQPISQKSASSRVASLKIAASSASRAGVK